MPKAHPSSPGRESRKSSKTPSKPPSDPMRRARNAPQNKPLLSELLGGHMAQVLLSPSEGSDPMDIVQRLHLLASNTPEDSQKKTTVVTTSITSKDVVAGGNGDHSVQQSFSTSLTVNISTPPPVNQTLSISLPKRKRNDIHTFTLHDFVAISALSALVERYGKVSHMGILDPSYRFFMTKDRQAALYYKVKNNVAVVGGDPLCSREKYDTLLEEFRRMRKHRRWGIVFLGATDSFIPYASQRKWVSMRFGTERVLNPLDNPILQEKEGKRMVTQNKQLLDPDRGGISVHAYVPARGRDEHLEQELRQVYDSWRDNRNHSGQPQAYMTVFDPFAIPTLMTYIYTKDREGQCNGFAALRKIGANKGYHLDPYCALPSAPRGVTDLLVFSAMSLLHHAGIGYLSFGFEPSAQLDVVVGLSRPKAALTKSCYRRAFRHLPIGGKKAYHDKFRPDSSLESGLHIVYPNGAPSLQDALATLHFANVEVGGLLRRELFGGWSLKGRGAGTSTTEGGKESSCSES